MTRQQALTHITEYLGCRKAIARRILDIADQYGFKAEPCVKGILGVYSTNSRYIIEKPRKDFRTDRRVAVAPKVPHRYTSVTEVVPTEKSPIKRRPVMAPKPKPKAAEPEVEETEDEAKDYTVYADKPISATMQDFADWLREEVGDIDEMPADRVVALAGTLRMEFQRSEFNQTRRAERRAARAQAAPEPEEDDEDEAPAKPARSARKPAAAAPAKPSAAPKKAPARRGKATAGAAAPY